jgi:prefoldin subunit 5
MLNIGPSDDSAAAGTASRRRLAQAAVTDPELASRPGVARLEHFLDVVLKKDLQAAINRRDGAYERASQCHRLRRLLKDLTQLHQLESEQGSHRSATPSTSSRGAISTTRKTKAETNNDCDAMLDHPLATELRIDLGCHVYGRVEVADARVVHINVGLGIVVPMTHEEAFKFLLAKEKFHKADVERQNKDILRVKYRVRIVMESLRQLHERYASAQVRKR